MDRGESPAGERACLGSKEEGGRAAVPSEDAAIEKTRLPASVMMMIFGRIDYGCEWLKGDDDDFWESR